MTTVETEVDTATTPNGTVITFQEHPRQYAVNGTVYPSVTEVNDVLNKQLTTWGQGIGVTGMLELIRQGLIGRQSGEPVFRGTDPPVIATSKDVVALLKVNGLDHKAELTRAQNRGNAAHNALEAYIRDGMMPDPEFYSEEHRGYITGLVKFLTDLKIDRRSKVYSEVRVGSEKHGYAGTFDLLCRLLPCELQTSPLRKKEMFAGRALLDLKTSSSVYDTHHYQLAAYEEALVECGYQKPDFKAVVRVTADGLYEIKRSNKSLEDFLKILAVWKVVKGKKDA